MDQSATNKDAIIAQQQELIATQKEQIAMLEKKVDYLIRIIHGSKSEKLDPAQLELLLDPDAAKKTCATDCEEEAPMVELKRELKPVRESKPRKPRLPENLPVSEQFIIPDEVKADPDGYRRIGERISERLDVEPCRYTLIRIVRPTYIKRNGIIPNIITAPLPPTILEGSILTPSLLAHIVTSKFCDHLPLYRQEKIMALRYNINIPRNTLCHWMEVAADRLEPLWKILASDLRQSSHIKVDETPIGYLSPGHGSTREGRLWLYQNPALGTVVYNWQTSRSSQCLDAVLSDGKLFFQGVLQSDGYSAYNKWADDHEGVVQAGCWAHARRKFYDNLEEEPKLAAKILRLIQRLYYIENRYKNSAPEVRKYYRRKQSRPITKQLHRFITRIQKNHLPKSELGKAANYALNQWQKLIVFLYREEVDIDNNSVERAVRPTKIGVRNWMFIGGAETGWRSAILYTMVENCRILGKDPYAYLQWVFEKLPTMTNQDDLQELLPSNWGQRLQWQPAV